MNTEYLNREVLINISFDGTLTSRAKGEQVLNSADISVYSTNTKREADLVILLVCEILREKNPLLLPEDEWRVFPNFNGEIDQMEQISDKFNQYYNAINRKRLH
jgi:hypothetical protein